MATLFALGLTATSVRAAPTIDGNVLGFGEGYTVGYNVSFNLEGGPSGVTGGQLYLYETSTTLSVGLITPLTINDNTYGANQSSDWGPKNHKLKSLDGSDQWALTLPTSGTGVTLTLDYIAGYSGSNYDTEVDQFKQGVDLDQSKITFQSSLSYNNKVLGLTQFFDKANDDTIASPPTSGTDYDFLAPAQDWVPEIMYEFSIDKSVISGTLDIPAFLASLGTLHMSPNKLGSKNRVWPTLGDPLFPPQHDVPEPATLLLFGVGLIGAWRLRRRSA